MRSRVAIALALLTMPAAACDAAPGQRTDVHPTVITTTVHRPGPVHTIIRGARTLPAGSTDSFTAQRGIALRLSVTKPTVSRTRLSSSYGYAPAHGYYLTFRLDVVNTGRKPVQVGPAYFFVRTAHVRKVTSYDGNAPFSGASRQLDTTELDPGQSVRAPLTYDVADVHGRFAFAPDGSPAIWWRY